MTTLPKPSFEEVAHSAELITQIKQQITASDGWINFRDFMQQALYAPTLGYYTAGKQKIGRGGDFVTASEISPLFAEMVAHQMTQVLQTTGGSVLELGAGTGKFTEQALLAMAEGQYLPEQYIILEVSDHLRYVQQEGLQQALPADLLARVKWVKTLPEDFIGVIFGNEVLDALAVQLITKKGDQYYERGVAIEDERFVWQDQPLDSSALLDKAKVLDLHGDYVTEVCFEAEALMNSLSECLHTGAVLMVDYGFDQATYYHPQRNQGTLMCHYQQYAHDDPLVYIGLQDITAHVDFTQIAQAGFDQGLRVAGYTTQMQFLMNCGILQAMQRVDPNDVQHYAPMASGVQKLLSPTEMGELFKVMMLTKGFDAPCIGFMQGDKTHTL